MVRYFALVCLYWLMVPIANATSLLVTAQSDPIEYGKAFWIHIESDQLTTSLQTLDFAGWRDQVRVSGQRELQLDPTTGKQRLSIKMQARHSGVLKLASLAWAGIESDPLILDVNPPIDVKTGTAIDFSCHIDNTTPWQQQQTLFICRVQMQDSRVLFKMAHAQPRGAQLVALPISQAAIASQTQKLTEHRLGWVLIPQLSGQQRFEMPPIQLIRDGLVTHQFYSVPLLVDVKPLPIYVPGTIPVGQVNVNRYTLAETLLTQGHLTSLQLQVRVQGSSAELLPDYARKLLSDDRMQFFAAQTQHRQHLDQQGIQHQLDYRIPLNPRRQGLYQLPSLRVHYFEPNSGTLKTQLIAGQRVLVLSIWSQALLLLGLLGLVGYVLYRFWKWAIRVLTRLRGYRAALAQLSQAPTPIQLQRAMQLMAQAEGWSGNLTYRQWTQRMLQRLPAAGSFPYHKLYERCYAGIDHDLQPVQTRLAQLCRQGMVRAIF